MPVFTQATTNFTQLAGVISNTQATQFLLLDGTRAMTGNLEIKKATPTLRLNADSGNCKVLCASLGTDHMNFAYNVASDQFWLTDVDGSVTRLKMNMSDGKFPVHAAFSTGAAIDFEDGLLYAGAAINAANGLLKLDASGFAPLPQINGLLNAEIADAALIDFDKLNLAHANDTEQSTTNTAYTKLKESKFNVGGYVRVTHQMKSDNVLYAYYSKIYVNGVAVGAENTAGTTTWQSYWDWVTIEAGDLVQVYVKATSPGTAYVRNLQMTEFRNINPAIGQDP